MMMKACNDEPWFWFNARRWLSETAVLSPSEKGAFFGLVCLQEENGGPLDDNDKHVSRLLYVDPRTWRAARKRLLDAGKINVAGGHITVKTNGLTRSRSDG